MTEKNPVWLPIVKLEPPAKVDPIERVLRVLWSYEAQPIEVRKVFLLTIVGQA